MNSRSMLLPQKGPSYLDFIHWAVSKKPNKIYTQFFLNHLWKHFMSQIQCLSLQWAGFFKYETRFCFP